ncbi:hypothetical protein MHZ93_06140 [Roseomonas sp. ACRSG]|nr:hypothetical protein [Roseomonas sp. ACRSG]
MSHPVPTVPTSASGSVQQNHQQEQGSTDRTDCTDLNVKGSGLEKTLSALVEWIEAEAAKEPGPVQPLQPEDLCPADIYELEAMRQHYAARAGPELPPCTMKAGLLRGFHAHRHLMKRD